MSLRNFKKILSPTSIYESILMKIYMNGNIRKVIEGHIRSTFYLKIYIFFLLKSDLIKIWYVC